MTETLTQVSEKWLKLTKSLTQPTGTVVKIVGLKKKL